ncbi:MAG TPA: toll/interleukin-1 receptor domain-containing protein, partial [Hyphomicrobiales bacterium]
QIALEVNMLRNTVFISYPSEDIIIAGTINTAINSMPGNRLDVFLDRENMSSGQRIPDTIQTALRQTVYFVAVATNVSRRNFDWCGQELGFYQGSYDGPGRRETCLYHLSYPDLFAETHNFKVQSLILEHRDQFLDTLVPVEESAFYKFLNGVAELNAELHPPPSPPSYYREIPKWAEFHAKCITEAFFTALQTRVENTWYPQGRIHLSIQKGDFYKDPSVEIPADAEVTLSASMYNIFSTGVPDVIRPMLWGKFGQFLMDTAGSDILAKILADIAVSALPSRADAKGDYVYQAPNQLFYRVLLVKHSVYGNKSRELVFKFDPYFGQGAGR